MIYLNKIASKLFLGSWIKDTIVPALRINAYINYKANSSLFFSFVYQNCDLLFWDHLIKEFINQAIKYWVFLILFAVYWDFWK